MSRYVCTACGTTFRRSEVESRSAYRNTNKQRADLHENRVAKRLDGKVTIASGAMKFDKGDVRSDLIRAECKTTIKKSYSLKHELLVKIASETEQGKMPVFVVRFEHKRSSSDYYIVDEGWFLEMLEAWKEKNNK